MFKQAPECLTGWSLQTLKEVGKHEFQIICCNLLNDLVEQSRRGFHADSLLIGNIVKQQIKCRNLLFVNYIGHN
jgi:hypothetical protein